MGAGATSGIQAAVSAANADEVKDAIKGLPAEQLEKLKSALNDVSGGAAAKPEEYPTQEWKFETFKEMMAFLKLEKGTDKIDELPAWFKDPNAVWGENALTNGQILAQIESGIDDDNAPECVYPVTVRIE